MVVRGRRASIRGRAPRRGRARASFVAGVPAIHATVPSRLSRWRARIKGTCTALRRVLRYRVYVHYITLIYLSVFKYGSCIRYCIPVLSGKYRRLRRRPRANGDRARAARRDRRCVHLEGAARRFVSIFALVRARARLTRRRWCRTRACVGGLTDLEREVFLLLERARRRHVRETADRCAEFQARRFSRGHR